MSDVIFLPPQVMSESESLTLLGIGCKVSEEPVANIKEESKEDKDSEEIEPKFGDVRLVGYLFICNRHEGFDQVGLF
jgi:hypothetical protein